MTPEEWRLRARLLAAVASGALLWAAFPPLDIGWLAPAVLVPLLVALRGVGVFTGALLGLVTGLTFFGPLLWWLARFGAVAWGPLVVLEAAFLAVFAAVAALAVRRALPWRVLGVAAAWTALEIARARWPLGGFAWGSLGSSAHDGAALLPLARIGGVWLVSFATVLVNALAVEALLGRGVLRRAVPAAIASAALVVSTTLPMGLAGGRTGSLDVAAVQGNVQEARFTGLGRPRTGPEDELVVANHVTVTRQLRGDPPDLIVWPENAIDRDPFRDPDLFAAVASVVREVGAPLISGAILDEGDAFVNANILVAPTGEIVARYEKQHLVPFGEYVPWEWTRRVVPILNADIPVNGRPGERPVPFRVGGTVVGSMICYESTYPEIAAAYARGGAEVLVVTTNNASYGRSPAARQHLAMSRVRAVETGRALVHVAVSGISAIVLPDGRIIRRAGLFRQGLLRARIPLTTGSTPYTRYRTAMDLSFLIAGAGVALALAVDARRRTR